MSEYAQLEKLLKAASGGSWKGSMDVLNHIRFHKIRDPAVVFEHGRLLLDKFASKLEPEKWDVYEQTALAALDLGYLPLAQKYVDTLKLRWTDSTRVKRLQGMVWEATGNYDSAVKLYQSMIKENPANTLAYKRIVSVERAQGLTKDAIKELTAYLKRFSADVAGWQELASLELSLGHASEACFSYEELILADPMNARKCFFRPDT